MTMLLSAALALILAGGPAASAATPPDMPLERIEPKAPARDMIAIVYSGDGGWSGFDKALGEELARRGIRTVGVDSLHYFWTKRTPDGAARDLEALCRHADAVAGAKDILLIGYSFGADALPFLATRLPEDLRARVKGIGLLGLSARADFEMHVGSWFGRSKDDALPVAPEVARLTFAPVTCIAGSEEDDSACPSVARDGVRVVTLPGGHHLGRDVVAIADALLKDLPPAP